MASRRTGCAIHYRSPRRTKPFVDVNCAAFSSELVESELFGHAKGVFTGATTVREGKFEVAHGVLQERELERVGGNRTIKVDVRVLAGTNRDLETQVWSGGFREALYYRLNVVGITLPALRERPEDVPLLIERFLTHVGERLGRRARVLSPEARRALSRAAEGMGMYRQHLQLELAETGSTPSASGGKGELRRLRVRGPDTRAALVAAWRRRLPG